jgi:hypothetical protein
MVLAEFLSMQLCLLRNAKDSNPRRSVHLWVGGRLYTNWEFAAVF